MTDLILGYTRVSTKRQVQGFSLATQRKEISNYASTNDKSVRLFEDAGISGATIGKRPNLKRLIEVVRRDDSVKEVVVSRLDRLSRNASDMLKLDELFRSYNVKLVSLHEPLSGSNDAESRMMTNVFASLAQFQRTITEENVRLAVAKRYKLGLPLSNNVPLGYIYGKDEVLVDRDVAPLIKVCFKRYANGNWGYRKLANWLTTQLNKPITLATVKGILTNSHYTGVSKTAYGISKNVYPQIISEDLYKKVQQQISSKHLTTVNSNKGDFLYKRIKCPICGHYLGVNVVKKYRYYYCSVGVNAPSGTEEHHTYRLNASLVQEIIRSRILDIINKDDWQFKVIQKLKPLLVQSHKVTTNSKRVPSKERLYNQFENGEISGEVLAQKLQAISEIKRSINCKDSKGFRLSTVLEKLKQLHFEEFLHLIIKKVVMDKYKNISEIKLVS